MPRHRSMTNRATQIAAASSARSWSPCRGAMDAPALLRRAAGAVDVSGGRLEAAIATVLRAALVARLLPPAPRRRGASGDAARAWPIGFPASDNAKRRAGAGQAVLDAASRCRAGSAWRLALFARWALGPRPARLQRARPTWRQSGRGPASLAMVFWRLRSRPRLWPCHLCRAAPRTARNSPLDWAFAPVAHWPVDIAMEQRVAIGQEGTYRACGDGSQAGRQRCPRCRTDSGLKLMARPASSGARAT